MDNPSTPIGWHRLVAGYPWYNHPGSYPLPAYSEFMPAPQLGQLPAGAVDESIFSEADPFGWAISELEQEYQLKPGLERIARHILAHILKLGQGVPDGFIGEHKNQNLNGNPYWPPELAAHAGSLAHERYVSILPLALSPTQDDKGRMLWTFFGGSEQGPETVFWKSFFSAPGVELPVEAFTGFITTLLSEVYQQKISSPSMLMDVGFRILPSEAAGTDLRLPAWAGEFLVDDGAAWDKVRYLLTFRPFGLLPAQVMANYLAGQLNLLPFPGSLVFWGMPTYARLQKQLPLAGQIPLLRLVPRHAGAEGVRVPQSGWLHEPHPDVEPADIQKDVLLPHYTRTHRWDHNGRSEDELALNPRLEKIAKVLFSTDLDAMGLYDKPMARNCQLWTRNFELLLDGPNASAEELKKAEATILAGGLFGYRFQFPAAQVGRYEVYWHRPVCAYLSVSGEISLLPDAPLGVLSAYEKGHPDIQSPVELWPRLQNRPLYASALVGFHNPHDHYLRQTPLNLVSLLDAWQALGEQPLPASFARHLLRISKEISLDEWLATVHACAGDEAQGNRMQAALQSLLQGPEPATPLPEPLTFSHTATRPFETAYWNDIKTLAEGEYRNKDNADCVQDPAALSPAPCTLRDLDRLGDYLMLRHREAIHNAAMDGQAVCGELPFHWKTDFAFPFFGGWKSNQDNQLHERDILVVIPGKDRSQAVVLADHYDTAYMEDVYDKARGGSGARSSAAGADDNYSATAVLLQAAPIYLKLAREGRLEKDIWLLHLTGEEFPADCLGARHFCQAVIEKQLKLHLDGTVVDLSATRVVGVFVMDMIAHNRDNDRNIFQISPGRTPQSLQLAMQAHLANMAWNAAVPGWNSSPDRKNCGPGQRSPDGMQIPGMAAHPHLFGEIRTKDDPQSSLFNTDGQIFSDVGIPVVLFMENYDINRSGYHDTKDTLENIDLDYGSALAAIAIETCAQAAHSRS
ncbi:MAG: M28 family peptidase [Anaerolineales bacterium]